MLLLCSKTSLSDAGNISTDGLATAQPPSSASVGRCEHAPSAPTCSPIAMLPMQHRSLRRQPTAARSRRATRLLLLRPLRSVLRAKPSMHLLRRSEVGLTTQAEPAVPVDDGQRFSSDATSTDMLYSKLRCDAQQPSCCKCIPRTPRSMLCAAMNGATKLIEACA